MQKKIQVITVSQLSNLPIRYIIVRGEKGGSDYTDWSYVYFGSYPQSEVTDAGIISAIDAALAVQGKGKGDV